jgi:hypothetical protein
MLGYRSARLWGHERLVRCWTDGLDLRSWPIMLRIYGPVGGRLCLEVECVGPTRGHLNRSGGRGGRGRRDGKRPCVVRGPVIAFVDDGWSGGASAVAELRHAAAPGLL